MKPLVDFAYGNLELFLKIIAVAQVAIALLNFAMPRILKWEADIARMSLLVRDVFKIHAWFISLTLVIWGVLTWRFAHEMAHAPTELSRWLCWAIAVFWGVRCALQWLHYDSSHWRGIPSRTVMHWVFFVGYGLWTVVYAMAAVGR